MTPAPGVFLDLLMLKEFKFNDLELQILQGIWADFLELRITKELERQFTVDSLELKARRGGRDARDGFRTVDWRNTGKDSRWVTLFQLITEWYSNGLWKSVRMLGSASQPKLKNVNTKKDPWFGSGKSSGAPKSRFAHHRLLANPARATQIHLRALHLGHPPGTCSQRGHLSVKCRRTSSLMD